MTENITPRTLAETYFSCWEAGDFAPLRAFLAPDCVFTGVFGVAHGPDEFLRGLAGMASTTESLRVRARVADDSDVITWFDLAMSGAPATAVANWTHVEEGLITAVNVTFDPREILAASA
ncbi:nuclear transport factor 2 family protein [Tsukamurella asaccharolytica]|uniref:Nuclear transport factor 2 family protein n=1 Tax=Tsukamurella asaccharolytica TaxID=2592067 RepID=A0A5C5R8N7_9ACTN|nr:nuclear transport factor 2 family protein [Tsukamurella asaccharolytica]TWS18541.1 nuclear transport factor 2 family protein [Tsukamurella asaccharolytica]